eukprot:scaffold3630_cov306-Prasinococcus_capsulatus_cf.AAC.7
MPKKAAPEVEEPAVQEAAPAPVKKKTGPPPRPPPRSASSVGEGNNLSRFVDGGRLVACNRSIFPLLGGRASALGQFRSSREGARGGRGGGGGGSGGGASCAATSASAVPEAALPLRYERHLVPPAAPKCVRLPHPVPRAFVGCGAGIPKMKPVAKDKEEPAAAAPATPVKPLFGGAWRSFTACARVGPTVCCRQERARC